MIGRAMLIGIAKPMPSASAATAVLMPMTLPPASRSGPPLLPGLIAASVWIRLRIAVPSVDRRWSGRGRRRCPLVTVFV